MFLLWSGFRHLKKLALRTILHAGHLFEELFQKGQNWPDCSLPSTLVTPELPPRNDPLAVGWKEVHVSDIICDFRCSI
jgi:hypothetical protein